MENAIRHLEAAARALRLEAYEVTGAGEAQPIEHFTIAEDLKRIDAAIGPVGESIFARLADSVLEAYAEIVAARAALAGSGGDFDELVKSASSVIVEAREFRAGMPADWSDPLSDAIDTMESVLPDMPDEAGAP